MMGVDASILQRPFVEDEAGQHESAVAFFASRSPDDPAHADLVLAAPLEQMSSRVGPVDLMIAAQGLDAGASKVATFDRSAAQHVPGMELLK